MTVHEIVKAGLSRIESIRTTTSMNPLLWVLGLALPLLLGTAILIPSELVRLTLIGIAGGSIFLVFAAYFITLFREPDRLQSEEYMLRQLELFILERKSQASIQVDTDISTDLLTAAPSEGEEK